MGDSVEIILGNSNKRFSGVTSTMLQVLDKQKNLTNVAILGAHHLPKETPILTFYSMLKLCREPMANGRYRVFHARRNNEMIQALAAKCLGAKIKIAFTSTAQRHHSGLTRWLMAQMDSVISTCNAAANYLRAPPDIIIPHGIDALRYTPPSSKQTAWQSLDLPGDYGIGVFGRVRHSKGIDILVDAAIELLPQYPGATVVICGECVAADQSYQQKMINKICAAGLSSRFVFLGKQPFSALPKLFQGMSIVAALSRHEGFGLTPLEAMASGCAVLTSRAGAWTDIVEDGVTGFSTATGDVNEVKARLSFLLHNIDATHEMGERGRTHVLAHYTAQREAEQLTEHLLGLADNAPP